MNFWKKTEFWGKNVFRIDTLLPISYWEIFF